MIGGQTMDECVEVPRGARYCRVGLAPTRTFDPLACLAFRRLPSSFHLSSSADGSETGPNDGEILVKGLLHVTFRVVQKLFL